MVPEGLWIHFEDKSLQLAISRSLEDDNDAKESLCHSPTILSKIDDDNDGKVDTERVELAPTIPLEAKDYNDSDQEMLQRAIAMSMEADEDNETDEELLQHALAMSMEDENEN